jgi:MoaA/NifB/PqqE/SkfB family radical SAM enzyme
MGVLREIGRIPSHVTGGILYHLAGPLFTAKPRMVQFPVCDRCNARCIMCNRWQKDTGKEISLEKIREVFDNRLFSRVEDVSLHGGEPTLRKDLAGICQILQDSCPRLKSIWISTNGFGPRRVDERVQEIIRAVDFHKLREMGINVSIDGLEETHDRIRGVRGGFRQSIETIKLLKRHAANYPIKISIGTVIQPLNLGQIDELEKLASDLGVPIFFQPLMFDKFFNIADHSGLVFSQEEKEDYQRIISQKFARGSSSTSFYWRDLLSVMNGATRKTPCAFDRYVLSLYPTGEILPCSQEDWILFGNVYEQSVDRIWFSPRAKEIRRRVRREVCPTCPSYCGIEFSVRQEFFAYLLFFLKQKTRRLSPQLRGK